MPGGVPGEEGQRRQMPPPPPPPRLSKSELESLEQAPEITAHFTNRDDTPLAITGLKIKWVEVAGIPSDERPPTSYYVLKPTISMVNNTDRQITGFKLRLINKGSKFLFITYRSGLQIEPRETFTLGGSADDTVFYTSKPDNPEYLVAEILGVIFEDRGVWGDYLTSPPPPPPHGESADVLSFQLRHLMLRRLLRLRAAMRPMGLRPFANPAACLCHQL